MEVGGGSVHAPRQVCAALHQEVARYMSVSHYNSIESPVTHTESHVTHTESPVTYTVTESPVTHTESPVTHTESPVTHVPLWTNQRPGA